MHQRKSFPKKTNSNETQKSGVVDDSGKKRKKRKQKKNKKTVSPADTTSMAVNVATDLLENIPEERQSVNTAIITQQQESPILASVPQKPPQPFRNVNRGRRRGRFFGKGIGRRDGGRSGRGYYKNKWSQ